MEPSTLFPVGYLLTKIGQVITVRFTVALAPLGIRPKHYGLLAAVATMPPSSQQDLGRALGIVPSAIVEMIDDLETLGALSRTQSARDRRTHVVSITRDGEKLLDKAAALGRAVDAEVLASLPPAHSASLSLALNAIANDLGITAKKATS